MAWGTEKETERYMRDQLEQERQQRQDDYERQERERRERIKQRELDSRESPASWNHAFALGLTLFEREARQESEDFANDPAYAASMQGISFKDMVDVVKTGRRIYDDVMADAERRIADIRKAALEEVASRLQAEAHEPIGFIEEFATALRNDEPSFLTYW